MKDEWRKWKFPGIYCIRHIESGRVYVGQSQKLNKRIYHHGHSASACKYLYHALQCYGWDAFEITILERIDDLALLNEREQFWIDTLDACNPKHGFNILPTAGSCRGYRHNAEALEKIKKARQYQTAQRVADERRPERIVICVDAEEKARLLKLAENEGLSASAWLRQLGWREVRKARLAPLPHPPYADPPKDTDLSF